jgi:hypothetical protein
MNSTPTPQRHICDIISSNTPLFDIDKECCTTRDQINDILIERPWRDPEFRKEFLAHPRAVYALAAEQGLKINKADFLFQIDHVRILEETSDSLYMVLASCHLGCTVAETAAAPPGVADSCQVCGMPAPKATQDVPVSLVRRKVKDRRLIEAGLAARAHHDPAFKRLLLDEPRSTYGQAIANAMGITLSEFLNIVARVTVLEEARDSIYFVLPFFPNQIFSTPWDN